MFDFKIMTGAFFTVGTAGMSWVDAANDYGQLILTGVGIIVGITTICYTVMRARALRKKGKK